MADADYQNEQAIIRLEHAWTDAVVRRDGAELDRILADDFLIAGWLPDGKLGDKSFYIKDCLMPVDVKQSSCTYDQWKIRIFSTTAVVNCIFRCHAVISGQEWGGEFLFTDVWMKEGGSWRAVSRHSSPLIAAPAGKD
jgi:hypothetical protein